MMIIPLIDGKRHVKVDDIWYPVLAQWRWWNSNGYAASSLGLQMADRGYRVVLMHRYIMAPGKTYVVDHINRNRLDNRTSNLRIATAAENNLNSGPRGGKRYKGVQYDKKRHLYIASVVMKGKKIIVGEYEKEIEAAIAYNIAAQHYIGAFAYQNPINELLLAS